MSNTVHPNVISFLALLGRAQAVEVGSPVLTSWYVSPPTGDPQNEVVSFAWTDDDGEFNLHLTEGGIAAGNWAGEEFRCTDAEGDEVEVKMYRLAALTPAVCGQCGSPIEGEYCTDTTCCYFDWPQAVSRHDLTVFDVEEVEGKYGVKKRAEFGAAA